MILETARLILRPWEPSGSHIHLDAYNSLENDSAELILEKK